MKAEQYKHFKDALRSTAAYVGGRCQPREAEFGASCSVDTAKVRAAAVTMTVLVHLRELSHTKDLGPNDIQAFIDGFYDAAVIDEVRDTMGAITYKRKEVA